MVRLEIIDRPVLEPPPALSVCVWTAHVETGAKWLKMRVIAAITQVRILVVRKMRLSRNAKVASVTRFAPWTTCIYYKQ